MSKNDGNCPLCGGSKQPGSTTCAVDVATGVVVVRGVPALICTKCGDAWIEDPAVARLETIVAEARRRNAMVDVTQWQEMA
jgi:YgiT-type zinc finger domain-containing protein